MCGHEMEMGCDQVQQKRGHKRGCGRGREMVCGLCQGGVIHGDMATGGRLEWSQGEGRAHG